MPQSLVLYTSDGFYEPGNKYYFVDATSIGSALAADLAGLGAGILGDTWSYTRWVWLDVAGHKVDEGQLTEDGTYTGALLPPKYCAFVRMLSNGPGRPSSKYFHGLTESMFNLGFPEAAWLTALGLFQAALISNGCVDSDGNDLTGLLFRQFSRRRHVRRVGE